jgi:hypothetical protein
VERIVWGVGSRKPNAPKQKTSLFEAVIEGQFFGHRKVRVRAANAAEARGRVERLMVLEAIHETLTLEEGEDFGAWSVSGRPTDTWIVTGPMRVKKGWDA